MLEYLEQQQSVSAGLKASADKLIELEYAMLQAEEAYERAKKAYNEYATKVLPDAMLSQGIDLISTTSGLALRVVTKTSASIKKTPNAKTNIGNWLRQHDGENLIKSQAVVDQKAIPLLKDAHIPFAEEMDINTNALKKFICDALGQCGSPATITEDDIPKNDLNWYQWNQAEVIHE